MSENAATSVDFTVNHFQSLTKQPKLSVYNFALYSKLGQCNPLKSVEVLQPVALCWTKAIVPGSIAH